MTGKPKLYKILLGCRPAGRFTEQHDIFFAIGDGLNSIVPDILAFWPEAKGKIHIDAWREVNYADGFRIEVVPADEMKDQGKHALFFLNLGGYMPEEFDEQHYMMLAVASSKAEAIKKAKETAFFSRNSFPGATSHIDDKYGVDVDDVYEIEDILPANAKRNYRIKISRLFEGMEDEVHLGYLPLRNIS